MLLQIPSLNLVHESSPHETQPIKTTEWGLAPSYIYSKAHWQLFGNFSQSKQDRPYPFSCVQVESIFEGEDKYVGLKVRNLQICENLQNVLGKCHSCSAWWTWLHCRQIIETKYHDFESPFQTWVKLPYDSFSAKLIPGDIWRHQVHTCIKVFLAHHKKLIMNSVTIESWN